MTDDPIAALLDAALLARSEASASPDPFHVEPFVNGERASLALDSAVRAITPSDRARYERMRANVRPDRGILNGVASTLAPPTLPLTEPPEQAGGRLHEV